MKLIKRKGGQNFRFLTADESKALRARNSHTENSEDVAKNEDTVKKILVEMKKYDLWLVCDCKTKDAPILIARQMDNGIRLANKQEGGLHAVGCVMEREILPTEKGKGTGDKSRKPFVKAGYGNIIPRSGETNLTKSNAKKDGNRKTGRKRYSSLARLMFQLLEDAKINYSYLPLPQHSGSTKQPSEALTNLLARTEYYPGRMLNEVVKLEHELKPRDLERLMTELEKKKWKKNEKPTFWVLFRSTKVSMTGAEVDSYSFEPTQGMSINGEKKNGARESYWVITRFIRDPITRAVVCYDGYAHAIYSEEIPIPIDSNLERETMKSLSKIAQWGKEKGITEIRMHKPLFDIIVNDEEGDGEGNIETGVIPDFIVTVESGNNRQHTLIIETSGYETQEYIERKKRQHKLMKQLGQLITDPPDWPYSKQREFKKVLAKYIFHPDVRREFIQNRPPSDSES